MSRLTSRIHRGFHRIGVVLAAPVLLVGLGLAGHEAWLQWSTKFPWENDPIVQQAPKKPPNPFDQFDPPPVQKYVLPSDRDDFVFPSEIAAGHAIPYVANYTLAGLAIGVALALYVSARAIGWILDGFFSPRR